VLERELGRGGMATVWLARDLRHDRQVAIKVLHPELAHSLGPERFLREIRVAAGLQHPHILPVHDSGAADGLLWYTMPYVAGESLRDRLEREPQLPLDESVRIAREVADALGYAHRQGIVHRDIKPENILLAGAHCVIADFGLARALEAAGGERLTDTGLAVGTPAYMSPEQASSDARLDGRSDLYSLGCVLYEMLAGEPPFTGRTAQAIIARRFSEPPPRLRTLREVPERFEQVVLKALARAPADRFAPAGELAGALETASVAGEPRVSSRLRGRNRLLAAGALALIVSGGYRLSRPSPDTPHLEDRPVKAVAVLPFRVTGTDSSLAFLREGMVDLLSAKLSGTEQMRTVDPRTLITAWERAGGSAKRNLARGEALALMQRLGAGWLLEGEVTGTQSKVVINAVLTGATGRGEVRASLEAPYDSLTDLVDRLAGQLLVLGSGEQRHRLSAITTTSLPALRAYLDGRGALRRGSYGLAIKGFDAALELDSTFALAALGRAHAGSWVGERDGGPGGPLAWRHRYRLSSRDRALIEAMLGPRYPGFSSTRDALGALERVVGLAPDSPEAWANLGDLLFHYGAELGLPDAHGRSLRAYRTALSWDSAYSPSLAHLDVLLAEMGDTAGVRDALKRILVLDSTSSHAALHRWYASLILNDNALHRLALASDSLLERYHALADAAVQLRVGISDVDSFIELRLRTAPTEEERIEAMAEARTYYVIRGWPGRAQLLEPARREPIERARAVLALRYGDGDSARAAELATSIRHVLRVPLVGPEGEEIAFALAQYDLSFGRGTTARQVSRLLREIEEGEGPRPAGYSARYYALLLEVQLEAMDGAVARPRLEALDSALRTVPENGVFEWVGNLVAARLWEGAGEPARALAAIRRRRFLDGSSPFVVTYLREEGRLAALAGDHEGARRSYGHYLSLRGEAEPPLRAQVEDIRFELAALERASDR